MVIALPKLIGLLGLLVVLSCSFFSAAVQGAAGTEKITLSSGVTCEQIGTYSVDRLNQILTDEVPAQLSDYPVNYQPARDAVKLYRITYRSVIPELGNRHTMASGLLAIPEIGGKSFPVVSYQHGTVFSKTAVPSHPEESMETRLILARFAGQGYIVVAPDYFGKGSSRENDSYLAKASTQQACLDMLRAGRSASEKLGASWGTLFLTGWSQGGWATMVFLNKLESVGIPVTAAAPICAPEDLFAIINHWIHDPSPSDSIFLPELSALQLHAYEQYYHLRGLSDAAIKPEYRAAARDLYLNKLAWPGLLKQFPRHLSEMLQPGFIAESSLGRGDYWEIIQQNQAYRWRSTTPMRCYYGAKDEIVPPFIAQLPIGYQKVMKGAITTGVEVTGSKANHRGAFVDAVAKEKEWFDSFLNK
jgi:pimeloyl-ACP methyl ester carboxylesterase